MLLRIGDRLIDPGAYEVRCAGRLVPVEPQVFDLLILLIENRQRVVGKDEVFQRVWKGRIVSDAALSSRIKAARQALGDSGAEQRLIRTIHGRGFRFVGDVEEIDPPAAGAAKPERADAMPGESVARALPEARPAGLARSQRPALVAATGAAVLAGYLVSHLLGPAAGPGAMPRASLTQPVVTARQAFSTFKDCDICPEMVSLPAGEFMMGSPVEERGREPAEGLPRRVVIAKPFAIGKFEITVDQFAAFVGDSGAAEGNACSRIVATEGSRSDWGPPEVSFRRPGYDITGSHPVVCMNWHDAHGFAAWLRRRTGKPYRLPTEAEWEYAARAGTATPFSFGSDETGLCGYARFADLASRFPWRSICRGPAAHGTLPVGTLMPNPWGIFDMHGNAWEWVEDCWTPNASEIPTDGSAFTRPGSCEVGVIRGGSWAGGGRRARSAFRTWKNVMQRRYNVGFRVAL